VNLGLPLSDSITFIKGSPDQRYKAMTAPILPVSSPLTADLIWDTLIVPETAGFMPSADDEPLLWAEGRPLVVIRATRQGEAIFQHLLCNFSLEGSNAETQANLAILLYRFGEQVRDRKRAAYESLGEAYQEVPPISLLQPLSPESPLLMDASSAVFPSTVNSIESNRDFLNLRFPPFPGFMVFTQNEQELARFATHFADAREADFSKAVTAPLPKIDVRAEKLKLTRPLPYRYLFVLGVLALALGVWLLNPSSSSQSAFSMK